MRSSAASATPGSVSSAPMTASDSSPSANATSVCGSRTSASVTPRAIRRGNRPPSMAYTCSSGSPRARKAPTAGATTIARPFAASRTRRSASTATTYPERGAGTTRPSCSGGGSGDLGRQDGRVAAVRRVHGDAAEARDGRVGVRRVAQVAHEARERGQRAHEQQRRGGHRERRRERRARPRHADGAERDQRDDDGREQPAERGPGDGAGSALTSGRVRTGVSASNAASSTDASRITARMVSAASGAAEMPFAARKRSTRAKTSAPAMMASAPSAVSVQERARAPHSPFGVRGRSLVRRRLALLGILRRLLPG